MITITIMSGMDLVIIMASISTISLAIMDGDADIITGGLPIGAINKGTITTPITIKRSDSWY